MTESMAIATIMQQGRPAVIADDVETPSCADWILVL